MRVSLQVAWKGLDMDGYTAIILGIFGVVIIVALIKRNRVRASIKGPGGVGLDLETSNESEKSPGGVRMTHVKAGRDVAAHDRVGGGVSMNRVEAGRDIDATSENPGAKK